MYVRAQGVIHLMYWYLYFNLFQDLILQLWPWNQYLHLWSTTFNQFCPRLISTMDCLTPDTCSLGSIDPSWFFPGRAFLCDAVQREVTRLDSEEACCPWSSSSLLPPAFTTLLESWLADLQLWFWSSAPTAKRQTATHNKCKWPLALSEASLLHVVGSILEFPPYLLTSMHNLVPYHEDAARCPFDRAEKWCPCQHNQSLWDHRRWDLAT